MTAVTIRIRQVLFIVFLALLAGPGSFSAETEKANAEEEKTEAKPVSKEVSLDALIDELPQASLQEAFRILRSDYIKSDALSYLTLNRAALQGLLERLEFGATLWTREGREARNSPFKFHTEALTDEIGYVRFGKYNKAEVDALDAALPLRFFPGFVPPANCFSRFGAPKKSVRVSSSPRESLLPGKVEPSC